MTESNRDLVEESIRNFLIQESPSVMCLRGSWGTGKTFTWNKVLEETTASRKLATNRYSYISLFGLDSVESLRKAILENLSTLHIEKTKRWMGKNAKEFVKYVPALAEMLGQKHMVEAAAGVLFNVVRNQIICIDDVERRGDDLSIADILGLSNMLFENRGCRVAILLNEDKLGSEVEQYRKYLEKAVSRSIHFDPSPDDIAKLAIPGSDPLSVAVRKKAVQLGIANIRILRRVMEVASEAVAAIRKPSERLIDN